MQDALGRIEALEQEQKQLKEEVHRLRQQITEEIKTVKVEVGSSDVQNRLDNHTEFLKELDRKSDLHTQAFQRVEAVLNEHTQTISALQTNVNGLRQEMQDGFQSVEKRFDAIAEVQRLILERLPEQK